MPQLKKMGSISYGIAPHMHIFSHFLNLCSRKNNEIKGSAKLHNPKTNQQQLHHKVTTTTTTTSTFCTQQLCPKQVHDTVTVHQSNINTNWHNKNDTMPVQCVLYSPTIKHNSLNKTRVTIVNNNE